MIKAPEKIWVDPNIRFPACEKQFPSDIGYVREDLYKELEAKLAKATDALKEIARPKTGPDVDWTKPEIYKWRAGWYLRHEEIARTTLAELKGGKDG